MIRKELRKNPQDKTRTKDAREARRGGAAAGKGRHNDGKEQREGKEWTRAKDGKKETDGPMRERSTTAFPYSLGLTHTRYTVHQHPNP